MRPTRTASEQKAIDVLRESLAQKYAFIVEEDGITDRPDALFVVDGKRVAVECRIFTPERLMKLHGFRFAPEGLYQIFMPLEPHVWVRGAVNEKSLKVNAYKKRCDAEEAWLVLHVGSAAFSHRVNKLEPTWELIGSVCGVCRAANTFDRVYVIDEFDRKAICLYRRDRGYCVSDPGGLDYPGERLPISITFFGRVRVAQLASGGKGVSVNLNNPIERVFLQPLDKEYVADYSSVHQLDFSNVWHGRAYPTMYAHRKPRESCL
ncbi:hypothetical protein [Zeimonas arvi]|uniref:Uncharacterized protein n=1 Tax=Zeimonas arvi TaxID=2498847 RepID=A0A5C8P785_9BURK|nr:hypothetical protein [Zeimonas arvi]TXL68924.1 hypothetical protein FHP08_04415 [Zeimonas arvi]